MPILRAGPFGKLSADSTYFEGPNLSDSSVAPISCANDFSATTWPWRYRQEIIDGTVTYESGEPATLSRSGATRAGVEYSFFYQATQDFTLNYTAEATGTSSGSPIFELNTRVFVQGGDDIEDNFFGPFTGTLTVGGSGQTTLPASVEPRYVLVLAEVFNATSADDVTVSLTAT